MKRVIKASELPAGYLQTTRFNSRINDNNVLEAIEIAIAEKFYQWEKTMDRQFYLTSGTGWQGTVTAYPEGYYIQIDVTRGGFQAFVEGDHVIRKPRVLSDPIGTYSISGDKGHVQYVSKLRPMHDLDHYTSVGNMPPHSVEQSTKVTASRVSKQIEELIDNHNGTKSRIAALRNIDWADLSVDEVDRLINGIDGRGYMATNRPIARVRHATPSEAKLAKAQGCDQYYVYEFMDGRKSLYGFSQSNCDRWGDCGFYFLRNLRS